MLHFEKSCGNWLHGTGPLPLGAQAKYALSTAHLRFRPPQIDQILPNFRKSKNRDFLGKKYRGLGLWPNLEIGELVRWNHNSGIKPILQSRVMECNRKGITCTFSAPP